MDSKSKYRIIGYARKAFKWTPEYKLARDRIRLNAEMSLCQGCEQAIVTKPKEGVDYQDTILDQIHIDHIDPVGSFVDWNTFFDRLYCSADNLQGLCGACHYLKTQVEADARRNNK